MLCFVGFRFVHFGLRLPVCLVQLHGNQASLGVVELTSCQLRSIHLRGIEFNSLQFGRVDFSSVHFISMRTSLSSEWRWRLDDKLRF